MFPIYKWEINYFPLTNTKEMQVWGIFWLSNSDFLPLQIGWRNWRVI